MNDIEYESLARRSGAAVRVEAERISDSRNSLSSLLQAEHVTDELRVQPNLTLALDGPRERRRLSRRWIAFAAAAALVSIVAGVTLAVRQSPDSISTADVPTSPDTESVPQLVPISDPVAAPEPTSPGSSEPSTPTASILIEPGELVAIADDLGPTLQRTTSLVTKIGSAQGDLGWENCQECEPLRPWAPVTVNPRASGHPVFVADVVNRRWSYYEEGTYGTVAFPDDQLAVGSPVVGPDGLIYALVAASFQQKDPRRVVGYEPFTFVEVVSYDVATTPYDHLELFNGGLYLGDAEITKFDIPLGTPTIVFDRPTGTITIALSGLERAFRLPDGWQIEGRAIAPVGDGSVVARAYVPSDDDDSATFVLIRLWPDGSYATGTISGSNATTNGAVQLGSVGLVQLETPAVDSIEVARYELPQRVESDPIAGLIIPAFPVPDLEQVPRLLPTLSVPGVVASTRLEHADDPATVQQHSQVWVRAGDDDTVDAVVELTTRVGNSTISTNQLGRTIEIPGWSAASVALDNADVKMLELGAASGSVTVWTTGLSLDEVVAVATSLRTNSGGAGWSADALPDPRAWTLLDQSWYSGAAARTLRQVAPEGDTALEMSIWTGVPFALIGPEMFGWQMSLGQVGDAPALLFESVGTSAITWSPSPGVVVVLGSYGPIDALFEIAQSVTEVDLATWEAASTFDPPPYDGCDSMFC